MAFVLRGWQPHIEERPEAFDFNAFPRERSLVKFHLSEFRIWKAFWPWGNRGSVACQLLRMKTSTTFPQPQVASQHLLLVDKAPQSLAHCHASVVWWAATGNNTPCMVLGANPGPSAWQACDLTTRPQSKPEKFWKKKKKKCPCLLLPPIHWMWNFAMISTPVIPYLTCGSCIA